MNNAKFNETKRRRQARKRFRVGQCRRTEGREREVRKKERKGVETEEEETRGSDDVNCCLLPSRKRSCGLDKGCRLSFPPVPVGR